MFLMDKMGSGFRAHGSRGGFSASMYAESGEAQHMWGMRESQTANDKDLLLRSK